MKMKIIFALNVLMILSSIAVIIWQLMGEKNTRIIVRAAIVLATFLLSMIGVYRKRSVFDYKIYEDKYKDIIREAFRDDKKSYRKLMWGITLFNRDQPDQAISTLRPLLDMCTGYQDTSAVYTFMGLCHDMKGEFNSAIECYEALLVHESSNSNAWSNLGYAYSAVGRSDKAYAAYEQAIRNNTENPYAWNNMAACCLNNGEHERALEYALKALSLNNKLYQAMSAASIAYAHLGDKENAEKYCKMYGAAGGDASALKIKLDGIFGATLYSCSI